MGIVAAAVAASTVRREHASRDEGDAPNLLALMLAIMLIASSISGMFALLSMFGA